MKQYERYENNFHLGFWLASLERKQDILKDDELQCVLFIIFVKRDYLTEEFVQSYSGHFLKSNILCVIHFNYSI